MAAETYGLTSVVFGNPTVSGFVIQTYDQPNKNNVVAEVFDENGIRVHSRYDDLTKELSLDAIFNGGSVPTPGATFTYDSIEYEVLSVDYKRTNKGFKTVNIKGKTSQGVTLS